MSIQEELRQFYDAEAQKYAKTREKHRSEADIFLDEIKNNDKRTLRILELGCGSGRLLNLLTKITNKKFTYIGVDISREILKIARTQVKSSHKHMQTTFVCEDMLKAVKEYKQESFDYIIAISSFQHIHARKERFFLMKNFYRLLKYDGKLMMTNRSFSSRFISKYQKELLKSILRRVLSRGKKQRNDILIPWKSQRRTFWRFYHVLTRKELAALSVLSGFITTKLEYLNAKGKPTSTRKTSKNTLLVSQKKVFVQ